MLGSAVSETAEVLEVASVIFTDAGLKVAATPAGRELALRFIWPVNPANAVMVTVYCALPPGTTLREVGLTLSTKSGVLEAGAEDLEVSDGSVRVTGTDLERIPRLKFDLAKGIAEVIESASTGPA